MRHIYTHIRLVVQDMNSVLDSTQQKAGYSEALVKRNTTTVEGYTEQKKI